MIRRLLRFHAFVLSIAFASSLQPAVAGPPDSSASGVVWFPARALFPHLAADGTGQHLSLNKDLQTRQIFGSIGGLQRLAETGLAGFPVQVGIAATVNGSFIKTPSVLNVVTVDFFVNVPVDVRISDRLSLRTGWGHYSAHLADDGVEAVGRHSINYAKDYIPLLAALSVLPNEGFLYGGARIDYFTIPARGKHLILQAGAETGSIPLAGGLAAYGAVDLRCRQEAAWGTTQSYQLGLRLLSQAPRGIRLAYTHRTGIEERGQFYDQRLTCNLVGIFLDF
ncbi:MAG: DUF1207 domain-containing protein [Acidobacteria bacterium]|nr:MAG: DUF1207 domain-containing protein [Acidobacteriota bacterium]